MQEVSNGGDDLSARRANRAWLDEHWEDYRGQWVLLQDGVLLAAAPTVKSLKERFEISRNVLITYIA